MGFVPALDRSPFPNIPTALVGYLRASFRLSFSSFRSVSKWKSNTGCVGKTVREDFGQRNKENKLRAHVWRVFTTSASLAARLYAATNVACR